MPSESSYSLNMLDAEPEGICGTTGGNRTEVAEVSHYNFGYNVSYVAEGRHTWNQSMTYLWTKVHVSFQVWR